MKYIKYLHYLLRHKWFVMLECFKQGLYWQGIIHDMSKFGLTSMRAYTEYFYGERIDDLMMGSKKVNDDFRSAWLRHQHKNPHHWQHWILRNDDGSVETLPMPTRFGVEMICDWRGVSRALYNEDRTLDWYMKNYTKIQLHPETRAIVNLFLDVIWDLRFPERDLPSTLHMGNETAIFADWEVPLPKGETILAKDGDAEIILPKSPEEIAQDVAEELDKRAKKAFFQTGSPDEYEMEYKGSFAQEPQDKPEHSFQESLDIIESTKQYFDNQAPASDDIIDIQPFATGHHDRRRSNDR